MYPAGNQEEVARHPHFYATLDLCYCDDELYRFGLQLSYSYGGFGMPITKGSEGFATERAAREAGIKALLHRFPIAWPGQPYSVHEELRQIKEQIKLYLRQPCLF